MKLLPHSLLLLALCSACLQATAQRTDTTWLDYTGYETIRDGAFSYRPTPQRQGDRYALKEYYTNGRLKLSGFCTTLDGAGRQGDFVFYDEDGAKSEEGRYEDGMKEGEWKRFDGQTVISVIPYRQNERHGLALFYDSEGRLRDKTPYENGKRHGTDSTFYPESGKLKLVCIFREGKREGEMLGYYENGSLKRKEVYKNDKRLEGFCYNKEGKEVAFYEYELMPQFPGGNEQINSWLAKNMRYPEKAIEQDISGRVVVRFVITQFGTVTDVEALSSPHPILSKEAIRVIRNMPRWKPGTQDGEPVRVFFTLPMTFALK